MSVLTSLARAHAVQRGRAQPITTVRHIHVSRRPLAFVPLTLAGEANAPLAAMVGDDRDAPRVLVIPQPRNRAQRLEFAHSLGLAMLGYIAGFSATTEPVATRPGRDSKRRCADAPQIWMPNRAGIEFVRLFGRATRFRRSYGPHAVPVSVPTLGKWLTFFAERADYPGSSLLLAATDALAMHWATGQSAVEDANLAAILGWIDPPPGLTGQAAAAAAEDPVTCPPAGPATDPSFDKVVLAPSIADYDNCRGDPAAQQRAVAKLEAALRSQLEPTWRLVWRAIELLRDLQAGRHVAKRWGEDKDRYTAYFKHVGDGGHPQPKRDSAVAAAIRLNQLERHKAAYDAQRAFDDPLVMAEYRLAGEAFAGTVTAAEPNRRAAGGRGSALRPLITVLTDDPVRLRPGEASLRDHTRPNQKAEIVSITTTPAGPQIVLQLSGGMGRGRTPAAGSVPSVGEQVCYSTLTDAYQPRGAFPSRDDTPWTHGGPPADPAQTDEHAEEEWS